MWDVKIVGLGLSENDRKLLKQRDQMRAEVMAGMIVPDAALATGTPSTKENLSTVVYRGARRADELVREE